MMIKSKKIFIAAIITIILLIDFAFICETQNSTKISLDKLEVKIGQTFDLPIYISENSGIASIKLTLKYNTNVFSLQKNPQGEIAFEQGNFTDSGTVLCSETSSGCQILWYDIKNAFCDGVLITLKFSVSEECLTGSYDFKLSYSQKNTIDINDNPVALNCEDGIVCVSDYNPRFIADDISISNNNEEFLYNIKISDNPGVAAYKIDLTFDGNAFEVLEKNGSFIKNGENFSSGTIFAKKTETGCEIIWYSPKDINVDGIAFSLYFKSKSVLSNTYEIIMNISEKDTVNQKEELVAFNCINGKIKCLFDIKGDLNKDGNITDADLTLLRKALLSRQEYAEIFDANSDKIFDVRDLIYVEKCIK